MLRIDGTKTTSTWGMAMALAAMLLGAGCDGSGAGAGGQPEASELTATIGAAGGELVGAPGSAMAGVRLVIPPGALASDTAISIHPAGQTAPLPATAVECGPMYAIEPAGLALAAPATLTLPYDESVISEQHRFGDEVKMWVKNGATPWGQRQQIDSSASQVTVELDVLEIAAPGVNPPAEEDVVTFKFAPNPKFLPCFAQYPSDPYRAPYVEATVVRGDLNDGMFLKGKYLKPGLAFDMFTVQNSALDAQGAPVAGFGGFGLAWYQSDLEARDNGSMKVQIRTILLDQIFGFDPAVGLAPTNTFQVGFWFNDPNDAAACGFDPSVPTPFNGEHRAGPLAMITLPDAATGLGPLCTKPDTSVSPARCDP